MNRHWTCMAIVLTSACSDSPVAHDVDLTIELVSPPAGATILQNDPTTGCPAYASRGTGYQLSLDWTDAPDATAVNVYEVRVQRRGAPHPAIDALVDASSYEYVACYAYVTDDHIDDWYWWVRAVAQDGETGPWRERSFSFSPCRLEDGIPCTG